MKKILRVVLLLCALFVFNSSAWVNLTLIRPAEINLPQYIQTIIIVDRTVAPDTRKNKWEEIVTGEALHQDAQAIQQTIEGFIYTIGNAPRFNIIRTTEKFMGDNTGKIFPEVLPWSTIDKLCQKYKADAVIAVESFDSDYIITNGVRVEPSKDNSGLPIKLNVFYAEGLATVNMGFRLYNPKDKLIADQYLFSQQQRFDATAKTLTEALQSILDKTNAINQVSYDAGSIYAKRITPTYYKVTRYFYNRPKRNKKLMEGVRKSEVADWKGAIESWTEAMKVDSRKQKGRIALNIAVAYEVLGDMDKALQWASKSYTEYSEKMANDYVRDLKARINEEAVVKDQLSK
jgi:tetratricopeptide (TPR) repeat protein